MYKEIDLSRIKTVSIHNRKSKVSHRDMARLYQKGSRLCEFLETLPPVLKAKDFKAVVSAVASARKLGKPIVWMMGAHIIKCGLSPIVVDLMERKIITTVCLNGAGVIHDAELAAFGHTSEDVAENLVNGTFGMSQETAELINGALKMGKENQLGYGESIGKRLVEDNVPHKGLSICAAGFRLRTPVLVFVGIGTEITHQHPSTDGGTIGELSMRDFRIFCQQLTELSIGGVVLNIGSAVILPEVFLKALTVVRNLGYPAEGFTAANFDMIQHYRPSENVVTRPTRGGGKGYQITGHHELMIPLLAAAVIEQVE